MPLAEYFADKYEILLIDQYGCGKSDAPSEALDSQLYANLYAEFIQSLDPKTNIFIGHSYGARVIIQLASQFPELISKAIFVAGAGLVKKRSCSFKIRAKFLKKLGKTCKLLDNVFSTQFKRKFSDKFGSQDYKEAQGLMRAILVKAVTENLTDKLSQITCPTLLLYGTKDTVTPPEFGQAFDKNIKDSKLILIDGADHNSILSISYHQLQNIIEDFL